MGNELSRKKTEIVQEPFMFELDENGEIVDYVEHPEDFCLDEFHIVGNPELEILS